MKKRRFRDVKKGVINTPLKKETSLRFASKMVKFKAFITDMFMIVMPILYIVIYLLMGDRETFAQNRLIGWIEILIPYLIITTAFLYYKGQTPGMKAYNLKLVDIKGEKLSLLRVLIREILGVVSFFFFGWIIGLFRKDSRALHEILTNSAIIELDSNE
jgi:uncharacterized RDD family membrane protein YckC